MRNGTRNNLNPHRIPNVAKYEAVAKFPSTWARMVNSTDFDATNGCWEWQRGLNEGGYGIFSHHEYGPVLAHRLALHVVGRPVPVDMTVDHLCRNRRCVNPGHLEIVTMGVNVLRGTGQGAKNARKTECAHGHPYDELNTGHSVARGKPIRYCKACARARTERARNSHATT